MRYLLLSIVLWPIMAHTQVVNGYAEVTAITTNVLTIGTTNEVAASFTVGKDVVIMQMQDDVIGANTGNTEGFGNLSDIKNAGRYTVRTITAVTRVSGVLTSVTLNNPPPFTFNLGANAAVQAITFERFGGGGNFTTTSAMSALPWNGLLGGVLAVQVGGALTLAHNITADGAGFRGGARDAYSYTSPCNTTDFVWSSTAAGTEFFATKGEGIYRNTSTALADGRGKMLNGGGGANQINAGGGGGGNYTAGGSAGLGWSCTAEAGGIGGLGLSAHISASRVFMGGGGGGGEGNDNVSTDGAPGGGIILIKATELVTTGTCASRRISAEGGTAATSGNDGAGGAGAGGSIVLQVPLYTFSVSCALTISVNGGTGGTVNNTTHGGGGGGAQGVVVFSTPTPTGNVVIQTNNGLGGCNETPCVTRAGSGAGVNGAGIIPGANGPLPIELLAFDAQPEHSSVNVRWSTASELNNALFTVQRSMDMQVWADVSYVPGAINSQVLRNYGITDARPLPNTSYYRLQQTDLDGTSTWSDAVAVHFTNNGLFTMSLFPNPAEDRLTVLCDQLDGTSTVMVLDAVGRQIAVPMTVETGHAELHVSNLMTGSYSLRIATANGHDVQRFVVRHAK